MTTALSDPLVGQLLDGRYRIVARIARGGMATVYEAVDTRLDRVVAVKSMHANLVDDDDFVARFIREARSAARLSHANVVAVFDQGTAGDPYSPHRVVYLVMELVRGRTLRQVLRERGPLVPRDALMVAEPVLAALRAAHEARIVHRDVKPENVLLADDGRVKVADFGLARALSADSQHTRTSGLLLGTVSYLAPEQVLGQEVDARTDVYSAGILLFEMLTGTKPFQADTPIQVAYRHVHDRVPAPSSRRAGIPPALDRLVARATDPDRDGRFVDGRDFLAAVRATSADLVSGRLEPAPPRPAGAHPAPAPSAHDRPALPPPGATPPRPAQSPPAQSRPAQSRPGLPRPPQLAADETTVVRRPGPPPPRPAGATALGAGGTAGGTAGLGSTGGAQPAPVPSFPTPPLTTPSVTTQPPLTQSAPPLPAGRRPGAGRRRRRGRVVRTTGRPPSLAQQRARHALLARRRRTRGAVALVVVLVVAVALGVAGWWFGSGRFATVPPLAGTSESAARASLAAADLRMAVGDSRYDAAVPAGYVLATGAPPNARVARGGTVSVVVSRGVEKAAVPTLVGTTEAAADDALRAAGLTPGAVSRVNSQDQPAGQVAGTSPAAGAAIPLGTPVDLQVSKGPEPVANPAVVGRSLADARAALGAVGLPVVVRSAPSATVPAGTVTAQAPGDGPVPPRTAVTLTVSAGRPQVAVPTDLRGADVAAATRELTAAGFPVTVVHDPARYAGLDRVWSWTPAGASLPYGTPVVLTTV